MCRDIQRKHYQPTLNQSYNKATTSISPKGQNRVLMAYQRLCSICAEPGQNDAHALIMTCLHYRWGMLGKGVGERGWRFCERYFLRKVGF